MLCSTNYVTTNISCMMKVKKRDGVGVRDDSEHDRRRIKRQANKIYTYRTVYSARRGNKLRR